MCTEVLRIYAAVAAMSCIFSICTSYVYAAEPSVARQGGQVEKKELSISSDGKAIVDQNGREVARFVKDIQMKPTEKMSQKLQGCMCCVPECIAWDQNGNCVKEYSSCTWDFDCNCKK